MAAPSTVPTPRHVLTPDLTPLQAASLRDNLLRLTGLPEAAASGVYINADRIAGRYLLSTYAADPQRASGIIAELLEEHRQNAQLVAYIAGLALGVRLGRRFSLPPKPRAKWISDEYKRLAEPNRRDVQKYIRKLLKAQEPPPPRAARAEDETATAREWARRVGREARAGR
jgi:hypothetical protein